jgi:AcrR family transcriptional regulator
MTTVTPRGLERRERLLQAAAELVARRGFHAVGIGEIGAAAGVTGSAIYRHFDSKQEILVALFDSVVDELLDGARAAVRDADHPRARLRALVERHVDFALRDRSIIAVYDQESHNLPERDRHRLRRKQRVYADVWVDVAEPLRPDLGRPALTAAVHGVFGLLNSVSDHSVRVPESVLAELLSGMAVAALES